MSIIVDYNGKKVNIPVSYGNADMADVRKLLGDDVIGLQSGIRKFSPDPSGKLKGLLTNNTYRAVTTNPNPSRSMYRRSKHESDFSGMSTRSSSCEPSDKTFLRKTTPPERMPPPRIPVPGSPKSPPSTPATSASPVPHVKRSLPPTPKKASPGARSSSLTRSEGGELSQSRTNSISQAKPNRAAPLPPKSSSSLRSIPTRSPPPPPAKAKSAAPPQSTKVPAHQRSSSNQDSTGTPRVVPEARSETAKLKPTQPKHKPPQRKPPTAGLRATAPGGTSSSITEASLTRSSQGSRSTPAAKNPEPEELRLLPMQIDSPNVVEGGCPAIDIDGKGSDDVCADAPEKAKKYRQTLIQRHPGCVVKYHDLLRKCVGNVPLWIPDEKSEKCLFCQRKFTVIERRHHCRKCGALVCGNCANFKLLLDEVVSKKPARTCVFCFVKFYDESQENMRKRKLKGEDVEADDGMDDGMFITTPDVKEDSAEPLPEDKTERMRLLTIKEIVDTERQYVEDLHVLSDVFMFPIQMSGSLTKDQLNRLFSCVEAFGPVHETLLHKFEEDKKEGREINIGEGFLTICDYLKMYTTYCSNHDAAVELIGDLKKNPEFMRTLNICKGDPRVRNQDLDSFIIKPVQRICKYPLFFRELLKYTPEDHPDRKSLEEAAKMVEGAVRSINEGKRKIESQAKIISMLETLDYDWPEGELVTPSRIFMSEVKIRAEDNKGKMQEVVLILFNDLVLVTNNVSGRRKPRTVIGYIPIDEMLVSYIPDTTEKKNRFEVRRSKAPDGNKPQSFMFYANDEFEMFRIVEDLTSLKDEEKLIAKSRMDAPAPSI